MKTPYLGVHQTGSSSNGDSLAAVKTVFGWAAQNLKVPSNPAEGVRVATGKRRTEGKLPYANEEAKRILLASRKEAGLLRWVPWLEGLSGARVSEVVECFVSDVRETEGIHYLNIEADADMGKSTKTASSDRLVPLHPAVIAEGFLEYVASLPKDGPLFPDVTPDKYGRRGANGSRTVARWVRGKVGLTDDRKAPNHAWRHWFISQCRAVGVPEEARDRIVGQKNAKASEGRNYGEYDLRVLRDEVAKVKSPV